MRASSAYFGMLMPSLDGASSVSSWTRSIASGGITTLGDIIALREMDLYGAILGKALYTGDLDLRDAVKLARVNRP